MNTKSTNRSLYILLYFLIETKSSYVKIHGTEYSDLIPNEYIVAFNTRRLKDDIGTYLETKENFAKEVKDELFKNIPNSNSASTTTLIFPNYVVLQVSVKPQYVHLLQEHPLVSFIETNHEIHSYSRTLNVTGNMTLNDRTCLFQETGISMWGLSRITSREKVRS